MFLISDMYVFFLCLLIQKNVQGRHTESKVSHICDMFTDM